MLKLDWLNETMETWLKAQQAEAIKNDDRTRDIFCRRSAVVGFRAGMLAFFLWGEPRRVTPTIRKNVRDFAVWVANCMLNQHLLRFNIQGYGSNTMNWPEVYEKLGDEFTREELDRELEAAGVESKSKVVLYKWRLAGVIEDVKHGRGKTGQKQAIKFKKIKVH